MGFPKQHAENASLEHFVDTDRIEKKEALLSGSTFSIKILL